MPHLVCVQAVSVPHACNLSNPTVKSGPQLCPAGYALLGEQHAVHVWKEGLAGEGVSLHSQQGLQDRHCELGSSQLFAYSYADGFLRIQAKSEVLMLQKKIEGLQVCFASCSGRWGCQGCCCPHSPCTFWKQASKALAMGGRLLPALAPANSWTS